MGANLDRLMKSYGVSTPTLSSYSGTAPTALAAGAKPEEQGAYQGALAKYNAEKEAYNQYAKDYYNRITGTDLYSSPYMNIRPEEKQKAQWGINLTTPDYAAVAPPKANVSGSTNPDYSSVVNAAYNSVGRKGIGTDPSTIDQAGYDYWSKQLSSGAVSPTDFLKSFSGGVQADIAKNPNTIGSKYEQDYMSQHPNADPYANLVNTAYAGIGRTGVGEGMTHIDQPGYDYWLGQLKSGAIDSAKFLPSFGGDINKYLGANPSNDYTKYVQGYLGIKPTAAAANPITSIDNTPMAAPTVVPDVTPAGPDDWAYAHGGSVQHFARGGIGRVDGGINDLADKYAMDNPAELPEIYAQADTGTRTDAAPASVAQRTVGSAVSPPSGTFELNADQLRKFQASAQAVGEQPMQRGSPGPVEGAPVRTEPPASPAAAVVAAAAPSADDAREALYKKYFTRPAESSALVEARKKSADSQAAFLAAVNDQMGKTEENAPSKAEMYFRLAAALASPTKTGGIMENVALAAKELGDFQKSTTDAKKAAAAAKLQMLLKTHEITWQVAKEELAALEKAESEENVNRRTFGTELIKEQQKNLEPKSDVAKKLVDAGLTPGTPEFIKKMNEATELENKQKAQTVATQAASEERKAEEAKKLTPAEVKLKTSLDSDISTQEEALRQIEIAIENSPKAFDNTLAGVAKRKFAENKNIFGGKPDPQVTATERMEAALGHNILQSASSMKGSLSDKDLSFLRGLSGVGSKSSDARNQILTDAKDKLEREIAKSRKQQADVLAGRYREKTLTQGTE